MSKSRLGLTAGLAVVAALADRLRLGLSRASRSRSATSEITVNEVDDDRLAVLPRSWRTQLERQRPDRAQPLLPAAASSATLALRSIAEQVAAEYGVEPGAVYDETRSPSSRSSVAVLEDDREETVVEVESAHGVRRGGPGRRRRGAARGGGHRRPGAYADTGRPRRGRSSTAWVATQRRDLRPAASGSTWSRAGQPGRHLPVPAGRRARRGRATPSSPTRRTPPPCPTTSAAADRRPHEVAEVHPRSGRDAPSTWHG